MWYFDINPIPINTLNLYTTILTLLHWFNIDLYVYFRIMLVRRTLPHIGPFAFEYRLPSSFSQGSSSSNLPAPYVRRNASSQNQDPAYNIDLENELPSVFQFPMEIEDIGGTLVVELGIQNSKVCDFDKMFIFWMVINTFIHIKILW